MLGLAEQKDTKGKMLIKYFTMPCKPTKINGCRERNLTEHNTEKWELFIEYCRQDVEVERNLRKYLSKFEYPKCEQELWAIDQKINTYGVKVDINFINNVIEINNENSIKVINILKKLTGLANPKSVAQLKKWVSDKLGYNVDSLTKENVKDLIATIDNKDVSKVLKLRQENSKTSVKKYEAMLRSLCSDGKIRGLLQFYGASRTGRWAGRLVQVQNLPQNHLKNIEEIREDFKTLEFDTLDLIYKNIPQILSELVRTAFIPSENCRFIVSDFSAVEARIIAYLADEK